MPAKNATTRFSDRVTDYIATRPHYPIEIIDLLAAHCGLTPESVIADIGSGTGILTQLFLDNGNPVIGVEPNREMREGGEQFLSTYGRFTSVDGTSEATRLPTHAIDFIIAGQAFHWFDRDKTREEFLRIAKPEGWVVLVWNDRRVDSTPFLKDYEAMLQTFGTDYKDINHKNVQDTAIFTSFFGARPFEARFDNAQHFDFDGLLSRLHSSSYVPAKHDPRYAPLAALAREIFDAHQSNGRVSFEYDTRVYYSPMI